MSDAGEPLYLGVDAGNSKTVAVVADASGAVRGYGRAGCGDIYGAPTEAHAVAEVLAAVQHALQMAAPTVAAVDETTVSHAAFCLAGIDWTSDELFWQGQLSQRLPGLASYSLRNDGFALLRAGEPSGHGVAISAGTGAAIVARGPTGSEWSASMWIVDPLGGSALGEQAYAAVVRADIGVGPPTALREVLLTRRGEPSVASLLEASTSRGAEGFRHADLAREVLDAASAGDQVAGAIVHRQAELLARYAAAAASRVGLCGPDLPVVLGGSVLSSANPALRDATQAALAEALPTARTSLTPRSPVVGAVAEAISEGAGGLGPDVVATLTGYVFPPAFLLT